MKLKMDVLLKMKKLEKPKSMLQFLLSLRLIRYQA